MTKQNSEMALAKAKRKCTAKQQLFAEYYAECLNGTQAARLASYKGSDTTLAVVGSENLRKPNVIDYIEMLLKARKLSAGVVLARVSDIASSDISDCITDSGEVSFSEARKNAVTHLIKKVKYDKNGYLSIEMHDSLFALDKLLKVHGLYQERIDHTTGGKPFDLIAWKQDRAQRKADVEEMDDED